MSLAFVGFLWCANGVAWAADDVPGPVLGASQSIGEYRIGPLDLLEISAPSAPDITRTVRVTSAGQISLPLVGVIEAGGRTAFELQQEIDRRLAAYVNSPDVSVFVKEFTSQRITLEGEVNQPGIYPIVGKTVLLQALAIARGTTPVAKLGKVAVFRNIDGEPKAVVFDLGAIRAGRQSDPEVYAGDIIEVNTSRAKALFRDIVTAVPLIAVVRPY